nr:uncharacterized mitochondrial protein AtMg00810-like [Tanacetum cinerariifolium]
MVSRHQTTQQYGAILSIELTTDDIRNSKAYKEYYACATGEATPKPKASARKKKGDSASSTTPPTPTPTTIVVSAPRLSATAKGKQPARATTPTEPTDVERTEAEQLKIVLKRSRQETHISQQRGSGTDEGTGSRPGVSDVTSDDSEEELSWNSSDDEDNINACARFQVTPKVSHLHAVKRIFRYLKGQPKLGLWYPKDSPFDLEAFLDSDYAGASLDRKFTT